MATTDRPPGQPDASALAATCREASFVRLVARADGEALAAAGTLAAACRAVDTPYQASVVRTREAVSARIDEDGEAATIALGFAAPGVPSVDDRSSVRAYDAAAELRTDPDPVHALAGFVAGGRTPGRSGTDLLSSASLERRPGVGIPTDDPADVAHSTLAHAAFSGDPEAARPVIAGIEGNGRRLASVFALSAVGSPDASTRAATAIERALRPHAGGPFETLSGYADVLSALAEVAPGLGVALALGRDVRADALDAWREHSRAVHRGVRSADAARYDGLVVATVDGPVEPVARLLRDFRSPEPAVLAVSRDDRDGQGDDRVVEAGLASVEPVGGALEAAADRLGGSALFRGTRGYARIPAGEAEAFVDAVRGET